MYLGSINLASFQIEKIEHTIDTFEPSRNKIGLIRMLLEAGLASFDVDSFYMSLNSATHR